MIVELLLSENIWPLVLVLDERGVASKGSTRSTSTLLRRTGREVSWLSDDGAFLISLVNLDVNSFRLVLISWCVVQLDNL